MQYRLTEADGGTLITLRHTAIGLFPDNFREALGQGWPLRFDRVRRRLERRKQKEQEANEERGDVLGGAFLSGRERCRMKNLFDTAMVEDVNTRGLAPSNAGA